MYDQLKIFIKLHFIAWNQLINPFIYFEYIMQIFEETWCTFNDTCKSWDFSVQFWKPSWSCGPASRVRSPVTLALRSDGAQLRPAAESKQSEDLGFNRSHCLVISEPEDLKRHTTPNNPKRLQSTHECNVCVVLLLQKYLFALQREKNSHRKKSLHEMGAKSPQTCRWCCKHQLAA